MKRNRIQRNSSAPDGVIFLNYARSKVIVSASDLPTLVPDQVWKEASAGDEAPYFKVESIDFPAKGSGGVYDGSFFKSFMNVMKERAIPGSKHGHEFTSRPNSDFYTVGGRIDSQDGGKTGTVHLKVYIPPKGYTTDNFGFMRDARMNGVNFSLVTKPDFKLVTETDELGNKAQVRHFTASMGYERNDALEVGAGAMAQTVNSQSMPFDIDAAKALIEAGHIDKETKVDGDPVQNGCVYRSALRVMLSRANESERPALAELISMIDRTNKNGGKSVEKNEAVQLLSNLLKNGQENFQDIATAIGFGDKLRNAQDSANADLVKAINAKLGEKPLEKLEAILTENAASNDLAVEKAVSEIAGPRVTKNAKGQDVESEAHTYAAGKCKGLSGESLKNAVAALKDDPIMKRLNSLRADGESSVNRVEHGGAVAIENMADDGIPTVHVVREE